MQTVVKTIRLPLVLWESLEAAAVEEKIGTPDLIRRALSSHLNEGQTEARILAAVESTKKEILAEIRSLAVEED